MCPSYLRHVPACIRFVSHEVSQLNRMEQNFPVSLFTVTCVLGDLIWVATKISSVDEDTSFEAIMWLLFRAMWDIIASFIELSGPQPQSPPTSNDYHFYGREV